MHRSVGAGRVVGMSGPHPIVDRLRRAGGGPVIVDEDLPKSEWVNFHPLENTASTVLRSADLLKFIRALGYEPLVVDCGP